MVTATIQSIVTGLHERSRKGIMEGLRSIIDIDNHSAVDVGHLCRSTRPFYVQKPKFQWRLSRGGHQGRSRRVDIESRGSQTAGSVHAILTTLRNTDGDRPWLMRTGMPSAKQCTKELKGVNGKTCIFTTERRARQQEPKSRVSVKKTRLELWEEHLKDPALDKALKCLENPHHG